MLCWRPQPYDRCRQSDDFDELSDAARFVAPVLNIDRAYRYERSQYEARGISEYWIMAPMTQRITVLTAAQVLTAGE